MGDPSRKKRPRDVNALAKDIVDNATDSKPEECPTEKAATTDKNPKAVESGRKGGLKGGPQRAKNLTASERKEIARKAALARWKKKPSN